MSNNPFDRVIFNPREKPLSQDQNRLQSQADYATRFLMREMMSARVGGSPDSSASKPMTGFVANGMRIVGQTVPDMTVTLKAGVGFLDVPTDVPSAINGIISLDDLAPYKPLVLMADKVLTVPAPPGANSRIDIIEVRMNRAVVDPTTRLILDPVTGAFSPNTVNKTLGWALDSSTGTVTDPALSTAAISYKTGVAGVSPVEPTVTPGYVKVAAINVANTTTSITGLNIVDRRPLLFPGGSARATIRFRVLFNTGSGTQTVTIQDAVVPPGIGFAIDPLASGTNRGLFSAFIAGGQITKYSQHVTVSTPVNTLAGAGGEQVVITPTDLGIQLVTAGAVQNEMASFGLSVGVGTPYVQLFNANGILHFRDATGAANITSTKLNDLTYHWSVALGYS